MFISLFEAAPFTKSLGSPVSGSIIPAPPFPEALTETFSFTGCEACPLILPDSAYVPPLLPDSGEELPFLPDSLEEEPLFPDSAEAPSFLSDALSLLSFLPDSLPESLPELSFLSESLLDSLPDSFLELSFLAGLESGFFVSFSLSEVSFFFVSLSVFSFSVSFFSASSFSASSLSAASSFVLSVISSAFSLFSGPSAVSSGATSFLPSEPVSIVPSFIPSAPFPASFVLPISFLPVSAFPS